MPRKEPGHFISANSPAHISWLLYQVPLQFLILKVYWQTPHKKEPDMKHLSKSFALAAASLLLYACSHHSAGPAPVREETHIRTAHFRAPAHVNMKHDSSHNLYAKMMDEMMDHMHAGDQDKRCVYTNFLSGMIPHHQGAVAMARYQIASGKDAGMIALAHQIITEQQAEIKQMEELLKNYRCPAPDKITPAYTRASQAAMEKMMMDFPDLDNEKNPDRAFAKAMIPHHQAAIGMASAAAENTKNKKILELAQKIITAQQTEIKQMQDFLKQSGVSTGYK